MSSKLKVALLGALLVVLSLPIAALGSHTFDDVPDDHTFHADIEWLASAGVTRGCNPPANTEYCPNDVVTRGAMAAFMRRLAVNQVVDANTAISANSAKTADLLDGKHAKDLIRVDGAIGSAIVNVTTVRNVVGKTVTTPAAGFLSITSSVWLEDWCGDSENSRAAVGILVDGEVATLGGTWLANCLAEWGSSDLAALTATVAVPKGEVVVEVRAFADDLWGPIAVGESSVSIIYSPFGSGAVRPAGVTSVTGRGDIDASDFMIP